MLNAFRHHRGRHHEDQSRSRGQEECSTPFGITEVGTRPDVVAVASVTSAQRLSASQRSAQCVERAGLPGWVECSTPFGITEVGTTAP